MHRCHGITVSGVESPKPKLGAGKRRSGRAARRALLTESDLKVSVIPGPQQGWRPLHVASKIASDMSSACQCTAAIYSLSLQVQCCRRACKAIRSCQRWQVSQPHATPVCAQMMSTVSLVVCTARQPPVGIQAQATWSERYHTCHGRLKRAGRTACGTVVVGSGIAIPRTLTPVTTLVRCGSTVACYSGSCHSQWMRRHASMCSHQDKLSWAGFRADSQSRCGGDMIGAA